jgi:hypothetical protein
MTFNMLGLPGETIDNALETLDLNIKIGTDYPRCSLLTPYPGTQVAEEFGRKIKTDDISSSHQQLEISFEVCHPKELRNLHYLFQTAVIFPPLSGLIKKLIILPTNILFRFWWAIMYFFIFVKAEARDLTQTFTFALKTSGLVFRKDT